MQDRNYSTLINFWAGKERLKLGSLGYIWISDFAKFTHRKYPELETNHGYIQWIFPTSIPSKAVPGNAPPTRPDFVNRVVAERGENREQLIQNVVLGNLSVMMGFYGFVWDSINFVPISPPKLFQARVENLKRNTHNFLRISRIIRCVRELGMIGLARRIYRVFHTHISNVPLDTIGYWRESAGLPRKEEPDWDVQARVQEAIRLGWVMHGTTRGEHAKQQLICRGCPSRFMPPHYCPSEILDHLRTTHPNYLVQAPPRQTTEYYESEHNSTGKGKPGFIQGLTLPGDRNMTELKTKYGQQLTKYTERYGQTENKPAEPKLQHSRAGLGFGSDPADLPGIASSPSDAGVTAVPGPPAAASPRAALLLLCAVAFARKHAPSKRPLQSTGRTRHFRGEPVDRR